MSRSTPIPSFLTRRTSQRARWRSRGGYALVLFAIILTVMATLTVVLVTAGTEDMTSSTSEQQHSAAGGVAAAALAQFYSQVVETPRFLAGSAPAYSGLNPTSPGVYVELDGGAMEPCGYAAAGNSTSGAAAHAYATSNSCYHLSVVTQNLPGVSTAPVAALVDVDVRSNCPPGVTSETAALKACVYTRYQQQLHQAEFYDYLYYDEFNTIDPSLYTYLDPANARADASGCKDTFGTQPGVADPRMFSGVDPATGAQVAAHARPTNCIEVAYQGQNPQSYPNTNHYLQDVVDGPVYTDDNYVLTCGDPQFQAPIAAAGSAAGGPVWVSASLKRGDYCINDTPEFTSSSNPPTSTGTVGAASVVQSIAMPPAPGQTTEAQGLAARILAQAATTTPADITLTTSGTETTVTATGTSGYTAPFTVSSLGSRPLIYVSGDATVHGTLADGQALTIYASGTLTVTGDTCYQDPAQTPASGACATNAEAPNTNSVLGLVAGHDIVIAQTTPPQDRAIDAILVSIGGSVYVDQWWVQQDSWTLLRQAPGGYNGPDLHFYGAIATAYQPVFGGYDSRQPGSEQTSGQLVSGYHKDFTFDARLKAGTLQPPYLPSPVNPAWLRTGTSRVAANAGPAS